MYIYIYIHIYVYAYVWMCTYIYIVYIIAYTYIYKHIHTYQSCSLGEPLGIQSGSSLRAIPKNSQKSAFHEYPMDCFHFWKQTKFQKDSDERILKSQHSINFWKKFNCRHSVHFSIFSKVSISFVSEKFPKVSIPFISCSQFRSFENLEKFTQEDTASTPFVWRRRFSKVGKVLNWLCRIIK